jgi:hypothetical protein
VRTRGNSDWSDSGMPAYRFYFLDSNDHITAAEAVECADDADAKHKADALLKERPGFTSVEVWKTKDMVHRVSRA